MQSAPFPDLRNVPSKPELKETAANRGAMELQMQQSWANTQFRGDVARFEAGQIDYLPQKEIIAIPMPLPTPRPFESAPEKSEESTAERYITETVFRETNDGDLSDFLDSLERSNLAVRKANPRPVFNPDPDGFQNQ